MGVSSMQGCRSSCILVSADAQPGQEAYNRRPTMTRLVLIGSVLCTCFLSTLAGDNPRFFVITVPDAQFAAVKGKVADLLIEQRTFANTAERRAWVMEGWRDYVRKDNTSIVVKVYCDSVQHLEEGGIKLTGQRLDKMSSSVNGTMVTITVSDDPLDLMDKLGLQEKEEPMAKLFLPLLQEKEEPMVGKPEVRTQP